MFHDPVTGDLVDEFVSIGEYYASQADGTPPHYITAYTRQAETQLLDVYYDARQYYEGHPDASDAELLARITPRLKTNADNVRKMIDFNVFLRDDDEKKSDAAVASAEPANGSKEQ